MNMAFHAVLCLKILCSKAFDAIPSAMQVLVLAAAGCETKDVRQHNLDSYSAKTCLFWQARLHTHICVANACTHAPMCAHVRAQVSWVWPTDLKRRASYQTGI